MATGLLGEIHRRFLWQTLLLYCGGAVAALWALAWLDGVLALPAPLLRIGQALILLGLPLVLATAAVGGGVPHPDERALQAGAIPGDIENERAFAPKSPRHVRGPRAAQLLTWRKVGRAGLWAAAAWWVAAAVWLLVRGQVP